MTIDELHKEAWDLKKVIDDLKRQELEIIAAGVGPWAKKDEINLANMKRLSAIALVGAIESGDEERIAEVQELYDSYRTEPERYTLDQVKYALGHALPLVPTEVADVLRWHLEQL